MIASEIERELRGRWTVLDELNCRGWTPGGEEDPVRVVTIRGPMTEAERLERYGVWEPRVLDPERDLVVGACPICQTMGAVHFRVCAREWWTLCLDDDSTPWQGASGDVFDLVCALDSVSREEAVAHVARRLTS